MLARHAVDRSTPARGVTAPLPGGDGAATRDTPCRRPHTGDAAGVVVGLLGGLVGLGGAESRLPLLIGLFAFAALQALVVDEAMSLVVVLVAVPSRLPAVRAPPRSPGGWESGGVTESSSPARRAVLHTNHGDITVDLFPDHAPKTVANFADLAEGRREWTHPATRAKTTDPLYDGTIFHRIISGFMIQGGDPLGQGTGGPGYQFGDEFHPELSFDRPYLLAMANAGPGTNGSQFFITVTSTPHLNNKHTIFGEVADEAGRQVVDAIATTPTSRGDRPVEDVVITSVEVQRS